MTAAALLTLFNNLLSFAEIGTAIYAKLMTLKGNVEAMVAQGREPTVVEWNDLVLRSATAHEIIQNS